MLYIVRCTTVTPISITSGILSYDALIHLLVLGREVSTDKLYSHPCMYKVNHGQVKRKKKKYYYLEH